MKYIKSFIEKNNKNLKLFLRINSTIFPIIIITYLLLLIVNQFWDKIFKEYINISAIFILLLISGTFFLIPITKEDIKVSQIRKLERKDIFIFLIMGLICSALIWVKIKDFGIMSYIISIISGLLISTLSILLFY